MLYMHKQKLKQDTLAEKRERYTEDKKGKILLSTCMRNLTVLRRSCKRGRLYVTLPTFKKAQARVLRTKQIKCDKYMSKYSDIHFAILTARTSS